MTTTVQRHEQKGLARAESERVDGEPDRDRSRLRPRESDRATSKQGRTHRGVRVGSGTP
jgi:hypothetical protein